MHEQKKILILRACGHRDESNECDNIAIQAKLYNLEVHDHCPKTNEEVYNILNSDIQYDYIYLSSHGSEFGFANESSTINYDWLDFGIELCESCCMNEDCIVMLSCCRGGLNQVAYDLFYCCSNIGYIVGPRQSLSSHDMLISFNILLYNIENRNVDPIVACEKIKKATDIRFICFDRLETETEPGYLMRISSYPEESLEDIDNAKEKEKEKEKERDESN